MLRNKNKKCFYLRPQASGLRLKALIFIFAACSLQPAACSIIFAQEPFVYDDKGSRSPFIALVTPDGRILNLENKSDSQLILEGIIYDEKGTSYAIINQSVVAAGDWIADYQVVAIEKDKVIFLKKSGEKLELELKKEE
jgi:hypothetical protein